MVSGANASPRVGCVLRDTNKEGGRGRAFLAPVHAAATEPKEGARGARGVRAPTLCKERCLGGLHLGLRRAAPDGLGSDHAQAGRGFGGTRGRLEVGTSASPGALFTQVRGRGVLRSSPVQNSPKFDLNHVWDARGAPPNACLAALLASGLSPARGQPATLLRPPRRGAHP